MELIEGTLFSPYLTFLLSFAVLYKWTVRAFYGFQWTDLGGIVARFIFCLVYGVLIFYQPHAQELRYFVRMGLNLLLLDEVINWGVRSNVKKLNKSLTQKVKEIEKLNGDTGRN